VERLTGADYERELRTILEDLGYFVMRSAGSLGGGDLAAYFDGNLYVIECKSSKHIRFDFDSDFKRKQRDALMRTTGEKYGGVYGLYGFRYKSTARGPKKDKWRFYNIERIVKQEMKSIRWDEMDTLEEWFG
jgi:Holliday junction resolvase